MYCNKCGKDIDEKIKNCLNCGKSIIKENKKSINTKRTESNSKLIKTIIVVMFLLIIFTGISIISNLKVSEIKIDLGNGIHLEMVRIKADTFIMGSPETEKGRDNDERQHRVTITRDYYIGKYPVTQEQWERIMKHNPSSFKGENLPVESVSWNDVQEFIKKLNQMTGKDFRLPTEIEWEYAARGGNKSKEYIYSGSNNIDEVAWYSENSNNLTHPVKQKHSNELGIYDMSGNVWEWCEDMYGEYSTDNSCDSKNKSTDAERVVRGGSWRSFARGCRLAYRGRCGANLRFNDLGFRLVLCDY